MPHIVVANIVKTLHIAEREPGTWGALKGVIQRRHRTVSALDGVSFCIQPGELVGYIGPNGAGKSTTVKVLSGILVPDSGRCEIAGRVPWKERISHVRDIGVVFGQRTQLWWDLPVIESFDLLRDIYRIPGTEYISSRDELIGLLDLDRLLDTPVRQLSLGQRMRCGLAAALLHFPPLLFLDEPTIGLEIANALTNGGTETAQYPLVIYPLWFRLFFTYVVPLAGIAYFPALAILDRPDPLGSSEWMQFLSPLAGPAFLYIALRAWNPGVRHYRSTGS